MRGTVDRGAAIEPDAAAATTGATVAAGGAWQAVTRLLPQLYVVALSIVVARFLGPDGMGRQSFIAFVALSATLVFTAALPVAVIRYTGELLGAGRTGEVAALSRWALRIQLPGAALSAGALVVVGLAGAAPRWAWILAGVGAGISVMQSVPAGVLAGMQRWREVSIVGLVTGALSVPASVVALILGGGITGLFAVEVAVTGLNLAGVVVLARRHLRPLPDAGRLDPELRHAVVRYSGAALLSAILTFVIWRRSEFFFLDSYSSDVQIALYSIPYGAVSALLLLPQALSGVMTPAFATLFGAQARERLRSGFTRSLRLMLAFSLPLTVAAIVLGPPSIRLVYGSSYSNAEPVLVVLLAVFPLAALHAVSTALIVAMAKVRVPLVMGVAAAIANVALDFVLIPGGGAVGAAVANGCAQALLTTATIVYASRLAGSAAWLTSYAARSALAAVLAGGAAWASLAVLGELGGLLVGAILAATVFALAATRLRILDHDDAVWLDGAVGDRLPAPARRWVRALGGAAA